MKRIQDEIERLGSEPLLAEFERDALRELWRAVRTESQQEFVERARRLVQDNYLSRPRRERLRRVVRRVTGQDIDKESRETDRENFYKRMADFRPELEEKGEE